MKICQTSVRDNLEKMKNYSETEKGGGAYTLCLLLSVSVYLWGCKRKIWMKWNSSTVTYGCHTLTHCTILTRIPSSSSSTSMTSITKKHDVTDILFDFCRRFPVEQGLTVYWFSVCVSEIISRPLIGRKLATSYDVARLPLMVPIEPWRNSTPFFGAVAFCTTKIDN